MAHVGKTYPFFFYRDWSPPTSGFTKRLPWQYRMTGLVAPPGPFIGWANKQINSEVPVINYTEREICWEFLPPAGADPTTSVKIFFKLTYLAAWYLCRWEGLIGGVKGIYGSLSPTGTAIDELFQVGLGNVQSPPWNPATPVLTGVGRYKAATWSQLGVTDYPGYPL